MISKPYPSKGTARSAAKEYAIENNLTSFTLLIDLEARQYFFNDQDHSPEPKKIVFAKYQQIKGKWRDRPVGKAAGGGKAVPE